MKTLVGQFCTQETCVLKFNSIEWNAQNLAYAMGAGSVTTDGDGDTFDFGGELDFQDIALKLVHETPKGSTITIKIWKAQGGGNLELTFGDDLHNFPMEFNAMIPFDPCTKLVSDWTGAELPAGKQMFQIVITAPDDPCAGT